jgi:hypothetical protein
MDALAAAYKEALRHPHTKWRANHQPLYAHLRDALADLHGASSEDTQNYFEGLVLDEQK